PIAVTIVFPLARFSEIPDLIPGNMIINGISDEPRSKFILLVLIAFGIKQNFCGEIALSIDFGKSV
ncbi:MAG: hypothetical protein AAF696_37770, partial [Bacteroidota bacterium]